jgi:Tfp pilus assembly protein PilF
MQSRQQLLATFVSLIGLATVPFQTGCATTAEREAARQASRQAKARLAIGADHLKEGRNALALREFLVAQKYDARDPEVQNALAEAYFAQGKRATSEKHYRRAIELNPDYHEARLSYAVLLIVEQRYAEAAIECEKLVDDPTFSGPWRALANLGFAEIQLGKLTEARKHLELALEFRKDYWPATLSLAQLELKEGHKLEAITLLREVLELAPGAAVEAQANYQIAEIYISLGQRERAVTHLSTAVAQTPDGLWGRRSEEYLKLLR